MGENGGIEQVLWKLVELLTAKRDEAPSSSWKAQRIIWHGPGGHCYC
jgi:hypothetical protein